VSENTVAVHKALTFIAGYE